MYPMSSGVSGEKHGSGGFSRQILDDLRASAAISRGSSCVNAAHGESEKDPDSGGLGTLGMSVYLGNQEK